MLICLVIYETLEGARITIWNARSPLFRLTASSRDFTLTLLPSSYITSFLKRYFLSQTLPPIALTIEKNASNQQHQHSQTEYQ